MIGIPIEFFSGFLLVVIILPWLYSKRKKYDIFKVNKYIFKLYLGIILASIYFAIIAVLNSKDPRILQNIFVLVQITHIIIIIDLMRNNNYNEDEMLGVLLKLAMFQSIIAILMIIFPSFKEIALNLYYLGGKENRFISRMRIFGISGDYTFFTPIYHGILATVSFYYSIFKKRSYLIYLPFLLLIIFLNGRFGLAIFFVGILFLLFTYILKGQMHIKFLHYTLILTIIVIIIVFLISFISPYTYNWLKNGFFDIINLIFNNEMSGNVKLLFGDMIFFPEGWDFIFGKGFRVYGEYGTKILSMQSDIGYINDIFMGGIIYIILLYGTIYNFILSQFRYKNMYLFNVYNLIYFFLIIALILSNYKGEVMRGRTILLGCFFIKMILSNYKVFNVKK
jgi:hypothetical protein